MNLDLKKKFQAGAQNRIGLDIGTAATKMIEIASAGDKQSLVCLGSRNVSGAVREPLIEAIKSLAEEIKVTAKEVNISVSGPSVIVRFVSMPKMRDDELKGAIRFEAEKYIPFAIDDCIVDHQVLKKNDKENKLEVLLAAVKKDIILNRVEAVEQSGFSVNVVDVDTFAAANAYLKNFPPADPNKTAAILNIGASLTNVGIIREGTLFFARDIAIGGKDFGQGASKSPANNLLDEIRLSFSYYENQSGRGIDEIYISGGGTGIADIGKLLEEAFESKPQEWDPLQFLDKSHGNFDPNLLSKIKGSFAVAAGLALR